MEEWRKIPGLPEHYEANADGRVRSLGRPVTRSDGLTIHLREKYLRVYYSPADGYGRIGMSGKLYLIHRAIALAFLPNPDNLPEVNHKNGDSQDNRADNLEWVTGSQNKRHAVENDLVCYGSRKPCAKLHEYDVTNIWIMLSFGWSERRIAAKLGVSRGIIRSIKQGKTWVRYRQGLGAPSDPLDDFAL
jgi:hypothetical protein